MGCGHRHRGLHRRVHAAEQGRLVAGAHAAHRLRQQVFVENALITADLFVSRRRQSDQQAPAITRVAHPLEQALVGEPSTISLTACVLDRR
jgi:hypothetical protein